jgi:hypothetical protein
MVGLVCRAIAPTTQRTQRSQIIVSREGKSPPSGAEVDFRLGLGSISGSEIARLYDETK